MDKLALNSHTFGLLLWSVIFLIAGVTRTKQQDNFYFDPAPINQDVREGGSVILRCDVSNRRHIAFYWALNDKPLANTSRRYQEDSDLRILRVNRDQDGGSFRCIATNVTTGVSIRSTQAILNILWMSTSAEVELKQPRTVAEVISGVDLTLRCQAEGNPEPSIEWFKNKIRLFPSDRIKFHKNNRVKVIGITAGDNGVYSCLAKNTAGQVESADNYYLNIIAEEAPHLELDTFTRVLLVKQGGRAQFDCKYENSILTEWYYSEKRLTNSSDSNSRISVYSNGTLVLSEVRQRDAGTYSCVGLGAVDGPVQSFVSELLLAYIEEMSPSSFEPREPTDMPHVIPENNKFDVRCLTPKGLPTPTQRWEGPFGDIPAQGRIRAEGGVLSVTNAHPDDSGNYTCIGANLAGEREQNIWIVVSVPPRITTPPLSERVTEEETARFVCKIQGTPYPVTKISWRKEDAPLDVSHPRYTVDPESGVLTITNVHLNDVGNYACTVNTTGHPVVTSQNAHLYVEKQLKFKPPPVDATLELASESRIYCKAQGRHPPSVRWAKIGERGFPDHVADIDGTLHFEGVLRSDAGRYMCIAKSEQGQINMTIDVQVVVKPKFKVHPSNTTAYEGYPVMLHCIAVGEPTPKIHWDRNNRNKEMDERRFTTLSNGSLLVTEVYMEDLGSYGCTAGNAGGLIREEIYLKVRSGTPMAEPTDKFNMMKTIIIAVCSAVAYLAIVIGLTVYCSIRLVRAKNQRKQMLSENGPTDNNHIDKCENGVVPSERTELMEKKERDSSILKSDMDARSHVSGVSSSHQSHSSQSARSSQRAYDKLAFPRHDLQTLGMLGKGHYGDVFLAKAHGIRNGEPETLVVVKSLLSRDEHHHFEFRREIDMFNKLSNEHVVKLLGVCRDMEPQFIITEYCDWGDLKQFLWATRSDNGKRNLKLPPLNPAQQVTMCSQVALGLEHLANHRCVHRDVAARNVLLSSSLELKVASLSLCRDVYAAEYFSFHQTLIPLRWMPPEAVLEDEISTKSDVWAFGVFCWEVFSLGDLPHAGRPDEEVLKGLKAGETALDPPPTCPPEIAQLIQSCHAENPADRPSFSEIAVSIGEIQVDSDV